MLILAQSEKPIENFLMYQSLSPMQPENFRPLGLMNVKNHPLRDGF